MELINECSIGIKNSLELLSSSLKTTTFNFNTSELTPFTVKGCERESPAWDRLGREFEKIPSPVLYWFEILSDIDPSEIYQLISTFKNNQIPGATFRAVPALRPAHLLSDSKILYVGCCQSTTFVSRMFWHFGYYNVGRTQGLQLCHWSQPFNMNIQINVISFPQGAKHLIYVYENYMAVKMNPITGKHRG
jgi:hypothetical protein